MSDLIKSQIEKKIAAIFFSDNSGVSERVSEVIIKDRDIGFSIDITGIELEEAGAVRERILSQLCIIPGIGKINIVLTSSEDKLKTLKSPHSKIILDGIRKVILVAAGKGGVGKSTIASLLAQKLAKDGKKVGILDADIYGPSIPHIFNLAGKPKLVNKRMVPLENYNVKVNSIGFITEPSAAISWRGPMVSKALYQLVSLTAWGELDYLIIDTPPGTGDIHLSLLASYSIAGVIMITTPQKIAAIDVERTVNLYKKFSVPIIGIIENMSCYILPASLKEINIFPGSSASVISEKHNLCLLAKIPLDPGLALACDRGGSLENYFNLLTFDLPEN